MLLFRVDRVCLPHSGVHNWTSRFWLCVFLCGLRPLFFFQFISTKCRQKVKRSPIWVAQCSKRAAYHSRSSAKSGSFELITKGRCANAVPIVFPSVLKRIMDGTANHFRPKMHQIAVFCIYNLKFFSELIPRPPQWEGRPPPAPIPSATKRPRFLDPDTNFRLARQRSHCFCFTKRPLPVQVVARTHFWRPAAVKSSPTFARSRNQPCVRVWSGMALGRRRVASGSLADSRFPCNFSWHGSGRPCGAWPSETNDAHCLFIPFHSPPLTRRTCAGDKSGSHTLTPRVIVIDAVQSTRPNVSAVAGKSRKNGTDSRHTSHRRRRYTSSKGILWRMRLYSIM